MQESASAIETATSALVDKLTDWYVEFVALLPNILIAAAILVLTMYVARLAQQAVRAAVMRVSSYKNVNNLAVSLTKGVVVSVGIFAALTVVGLGTVVATLLAGAGIAGLAIGFAFQDVAANFISGVLLAVRRPFREGEIVESNGHQGTVVEVNLRATHLRTFQGQIVVLPNKDVLQAPLVNFSRTGSRRIDLACGVAYGDDLGQAEEVALETIKAIEYRDEEKAVDLFYSGFGGSSIDFVVRFWVPFAKQTDYLRARSDSIMRLKAQFEANAITIPFPIRTLDFGVVGGEKLSEALPPGLLSEDQHAKRTDDA